MAQHIRFNDDNEDEYTASDSDDDLDENDRKLLKKVRKPHKLDDSENAVFGVHSDSDSSNASDVAESDIEGNEDDDLPDIRAWGKDKRNYYSTDYVDPDYGGFDGKDATYAAIEEEEAKNLQKKLAEQLDDDDYNLDFFAKKIEADKKPTEEIIESDLSKLSKRQKIQLLQKQSPELFGLIDDYKEQMTLVKNYFVPIISLHKENKIPQCDALDFVKENYQLILNYCLNIYMYLLIKSSQQKVQNHPVVKRLYQYRQLLLQMSPIFDEIIKPQIEILLSSLSADAEENGSEDEIVVEAIAKSKKKKRSAEVLDATTKKNKKESKSVENDADSLENVLKKAKKDKKLLKLQGATSKQKQVKEKKRGLSSDDDDDGGKEENVNNEAAECEEWQMGDDRRAITYQMAKNKGLMPHRKKELRNPRVKHRNKYRKAKIRRKGAVREVRKELSRYGGEMSGIKASVTKSIKIKS